VSIVGKLLQLRGVWVLGHGMHDINLLKFMSIVVYLQSIKFALFCIFVDNQIFMQCYYKFTSNKYHAIVHKFVVVAIWVRS